MNHSSILIVEDETLVAEDIAGRLKRLGYQVTEMVESGEEAIASFLSNPPDLVLMDIILAGDMDGIETAETILKHKQIPVVYLTAYGDKKTLNRAKYTEPFGYLIKPFDERQLHTTIEMALNKYQGENKLRESLINSEAACNLAQELAQVKNEYLSIVAHELRQPISQILLSAETLEFSQDKFDRHEKIKYLQFIQTAAENMEGMVQNMLFLGRSEIGKLEVKRQIINVPEFCNKLIEQLQLSPEKKSQIFLASDTPVDIFLDKQLLTHILTNLLSNAVKYSPDGGNVYLVIYLEHGSVGSVPNNSGNAEQLIIQVQDSGIGIPKQNIKKLFEPFHRCGNVKQIKGNGLGLSIVKRAVELQGGTITVESEVGSGTTFTVRLPLVGG